MIKGGPTLLLTIPESILLVVEIKVVFEFTLELRLKLAEVGEVVKPVRLG